MKFFFLGILLLGTSPLIAGNICGPTLSLLIERNGQSGKMDIVSKNTFDIKTCASKDIFPSNANYKIELFSADGKNVFSRSFFLAVHEFYEDKKDGKLSGGAIPAERNFQKIVKIPVIDGITYESYKLVEIESKKVIGKGSLK